MCGQATRAMEKSIDDQLRKYNMDYLLGRSVLLLGMNGGGKTTLQSMAKKRFLDEAPTTKEDQWHRGAVCHAVASLMKDWSAFVDTTDIFLDVSPLVRGRCGDPFVDLDYRMDQLPDEAMLDVLRSYIPIYVRTREHWLQSLCWTSGEDMEPINRFLNFVFLSEDQLMRMVSSSSELSYQEHLYTRIRTCGIVEVMLTFPISSADVRTEQSKKQSRADDSFGIESANVCLLDVGGPRSERKKWLHCFPNADALVYTVNLVDCHQTLWEDENVTVVEENRRLFSSLAESKWFIAKKIIVVGTHFDALLMLWERPMVRESMLKALNVPVEACVSPDAYACWLISCIIGKGQRTEMKNRLVVMPAVSTFAPTELWLDDLLRIVMFWPKRDEQKHILPSFVTGTELRDIRLSHWFLRAKPPAYAVCTRKAKWLAFKGKRYDVALTMLLIRKYGRDNQSWLNKYFPAPLIQMMYSFMPRGYPDTGPLNPVGLF